MEALGKLHMTVTRAYKVGLKIELHNFMTIIVIIVCSPNYS